MRSIDLETKSQIKLDYLVSLYTHLNCTQAFESNVGNLHIGNTILDIFISFRRQQVQAFELDFRREHLINSE